MTIAVAVNSYDFQLHAVVAGRKAVSRIRMWSDPAAVSPVLTFRLFLTVILYGVVPVVRYGTRQAASLVREPIEMEQ